MVQLYLRKRAFDIGNTHVLIYLSFIEHGWTTQNLSHWVYILVLILDFSKLSALPLNCHIELCVVVHLSNISTCHRLIIGHRSTPFRVRGWGVVAKKFLISLFVISSDRSLFHCSAGLMVWYVVVTF